MTLITIASSPPRPRAAPSSKSMARRRTSIWTGRWHGGRLRPAPLYPSTATVIARRCSTGRWASEFSWPPRLGRPRHVLNTRPAAEIRAPRGREAGQRAAMTRGAGAAAAAVTALTFVLYRATMLPGLELGDSASFQVMVGSAADHPS